jgi:hypothetical protein
VFRLSRELVRDREKNNCQSTTTKRGTRERNERAPRGAILRKAKLELFGALGTGRWGADPFMGNIAFTRYGPDGARAGTKRAVHPRTSSEWSPVLYLL